MPREDGIGPMGTGPMTGRGLGMCISTNIVRCGGRRRLGLGVACRYGFGGDSNFNPNPSKTQKELLQEQKELLQHRLETINKQLENL